MLSVCNPSAWVLCDGARVTEGCHVRERTCFRETTSEAPLWKSALGDGVTGTLLEQEALPLAAAESVLPWTRHSLTLCLAAGGVWAPLVLRPIVILSTRTPA